MLDYKKIRNRYFVFLYAVSSFFYKGLIIIVPYLTQKIVDFAIDKNFNKVYKYGLISIILSIILILLMYFISKIVVLIYGKIDYSLKNEISKRVSFGEFDEVKSKEFGYYLQRHNSDIKEIEFLYFEKEIDLIINILYFIGLFYSMFRISSTLSIGLMITIPIFILANKLYIPKIEKNANEYLKAEENLNNTFEKIYNNGHAARAMHLINNMYREYYLNNEKSKNKMISYYLSDEKYNAFFVNGILNICNTLIYFLGGLLVLNGAVSAGSLIAFAIYFSRIWSPVEFFLGFNKKVAKAKVSEERINNLLNIHLHATSNFKLEDFKSLSIQNLSFSYPSKQIFDNTSMYLEKNKIYYLKGANGSGKSTLFDILSGIKYANYRIKIDNINYLKDHSLEGSIYYVPSEILLRDDFDKLLIKNLFSEIDLKKNEFSSGEKRIIQLCSILKSKSPIILIDEPLNYVDEKNIDKILQIINCAKKEHTILISSHNQVINDIADYELIIKHNKILSCRNIS